MIEALLSYDYTQFASMLSFGIGMGFALSLFFGFASWGISVVSRLLKNVIMGG